MKQEVAVMLIPEPDDAKLDELEAGIPNLARGATREAYLNALKLGNSVIKAIDGMLYEVLPNGTQTPVKQIPRNRRVIIGSKFHLKTR